MSSIFLLLLLLSIRIEFNVDSINLISCLNSVFDWQTIVPGRHPSSVAARHMALVVFGQLVHIVARELVLDSRENLLLLGIGEVWHA